MKKLLIVAVAISAAFVSCQGSKSVKNFTEADSLAYALGLDYGQHAKRLDSTVNVAMIAAAIRDVMSNDQKFDQQAAYAFLNEYFMVRLPKKQKEESTKWLADVKAKNPNIKTTESGLMYEIISEGEVGTAAVNNEDQVMVNYKGTLKDGTEFDKNDSITFALNRVIPGWTEGMKLVGKGGEITLWVPSDLGYGDRGTGNIPANAALRFDVKLIDVIPATATEAAAE